MQEIVVVRRERRGPRGSAARVVVGKAAAKVAVTRNLLKRRLRAILRGVGPEDGMTLVVIARAGAALVSFKDLREAVERILARRSTN